MCTIRANFGISPTTLLCDQWSFFVTSQGCMAPSRWWKACSLGSMCRSLEILEMPSPELGHIGNIPAVPSQSPLCLLNQVDIASNGEAQSGNPNAFHYTSSPPSTAPVPACIRSRILRHLLLHWHPDAIAQEVSTVYRIQETLFIYRQLLNFVHEEHLENSVKPRRMA